MTKRANAIKVGAALTLLLSAISLYVYCAAHERFIEFNVNPDAIVPGMTYRQVVEALGASPIAPEAAPNDVHRVYRADDAWLLVDSHDSHMWYDGHRLVHVFFD